MDRIWYTLFWTQYAYIQTYSNRNRSDWGQLLNNYHTSWHSGYCREQSTQDFQLHSSAYPHCLRLLY